MLHDRDHQQDGRQAVHHTPQNGVANDVLLCLADSLSIFRTLTPALAISGVLWGMLASRNGADAIEEPQRIHRHLPSPNTYTNSIPRRNTSTPQDPGPPGRTPPHMGNYSPMQ